MENNEDKVYFEYITKFGDTLDSIAIKNGLKSEFILKFNSKLDPNNIPIGEIVNIPIIFMDDIIGTNYFKYRLDDNEKIAEIAAKFDVSVNELYDFNNINKEDLEMNNILKIPFHGQIQNIENSSYLIYTVKEGDSLLSISTEYGITEDELLNFNKIQDRKIFAGMNLKVPITTDSSAKYFEYVVRQNDTLEKIAENYGFDEAELMIYNELLTNVVESGMVLKIPVK